ncbi:MAG: hypothetical protein ACJ75S_02195, partial [Solirubrobacterales bacterium]
MFRLLALCTVAMTLAGCGAQAPPNASPQPTAQAVGFLRFVKPPLVLYNAKQQTLAVWVRLNRPLRHNVGHSGEFANYGASLEAAGGEHDIPGMQYSPLRPTCYSEWLWLRESPPQLSDRQPIGRWPRQAGQRMPRTTPSPIMSRPTSNPMRPSRSAARRSRDAQGPTGKPHPPAPYTPPW